MPPKISIDALNNLGSSLHSEVIDTTTELSLERCQQIVKALEEEGGKQQQMTIALLKQTSIGLSLGKAIKTFRRHRRTSPHQKDWDVLIETSRRLVSDWKAAADAESKTQKKKQDGGDADGDGGAAEGLPSSIPTYKSRLVRQQKDLYKDPPALPPPKVIIEPAQCPLPKRDKKTGFLTFLCGENKDISSLLKDFHPNRTPEEIMRAGSFGGTYFRPIVSAVTNLRYSASDVLKDTVDAKWIDGLDKKNMLTSSTYRPSVNKFGKKCGGSLGMWESSGWISDADPYGWFQWYCRFYQGRRCSDDIRQISRWAKSAGPKGRFRSQLCNKILAANTTVDDVKISPVIRQTLLHWGLEITPVILEQHKKRVG